LFEVVKALVKQLVKVTWPKDCQKLSQHSCLFVLQFPDFKQTGTVVASSRSLLFEYYLCRIRMAASQFQISSQSSFPDCITVALEKFSFAVSPTGTIIHQWVHESRRNGLSLDFRRTKLSHEDGRYEHSLVMSVSAGSGELLVSIVTGH
jgi:hypothetical protein